MLRETTRLFERIEVYMQCNPALLQVRCVASTGQIQCFSFQNEIKKSPILYPENNVKIMQINILGGDLTDISAIKNHWSDLDMMYLLRNNTMSYTVLPWRWASHSVQTLGVY